MSRALPYDLKRSKQFGLLLVQHDGRLIERLSYGLRGDDEIRAASVVAGNLKLATKEQRRNKEFVMLALSVVPNNGLMLKLVSKKLELCYGQFHHAEKL